jgi:hypothetical protein
MPFSLVEHRQIALVSAALGPLVGFCASRIVVRPRGEAGHHFPILAGCGTITFVVHMEAVRSFRHALRRDLEGNPALAFLNDNGADRLADPTLGDPINVYTRLLGDRDTGRNQEPAAG